MPYDEFAMAREECKEMAATRLGLTMFADAAAGWLRVLG
jgi:hypothetical protein